MGWYKEIKKEEIEKFICDICDNDYGIINKDSPKFINNKWHCYGCYLKWKDEFAKTCEHDYDIGINDDWDYSFSLYCRKQKCSFETKIERNYIIYLLKVNLKKQRK